MQRAILFNDSKRKPTSFGLVCFGHLVRLASLMIVVGSGALLAQEQTIPSPTAERLETNSDDIPQDDSNNVDNLFSGDTATTVITGNQQVDLSSLTTNDRPAVSGSISLKGGFSFGWSELPVLADLGLNFQKAIVYSMVLSATFDARPDPNFHVFGSLAASFPAGVETKESTNPFGDIYSLIGGTASANTSLSWSNIALGEVYIDYRLLDFVSFRIGKVVTTWGQGRMLGNPGNLVAGAEEGASIHASVPVLGGTWSVLAMARPAYFANSADISITNLGLASNWEGSIGPVNLGFAAFAQKNQGNFLSLYLKGNFLGIDLYSETIANCSAMNWQFTAAPTFTELAGFFWEGGEPKFQIMGEYLFNGQNTALTDHSLALGVAVREIPGTPLRLGLQWIHTFVDNSGNVILGMQTPLAPHLDLSVALPFIYGTQGSRYCPTATTQRIGLVVSLALSGNY